MPGPTPLTRRAALAVGGLAPGLALLPRVPAQAADAPVTGARFLRDELPWPVGVAIDQRETTGAAADVVRRQFSQVTAENAMKPDALQPSEGRFTFAAADVITDFAARSGLRVHAHTLVWHQQTPAWFFRDAATGQPLAADDTGRALLLQRLRTHVETVAEHYRQRYGAFGSPGNPVVAVDVVNEVVDQGQADGMRRSEWYRILGPTFVEQAFAVADRAFNGADPARPVTLFINDYGTEWPDKRRAMVALLTRLQAAGAPVDGVGNQLHLDLSSPVGEVAATLDAFGRLGLRQAVTELDVSVGRDSDVDAARLAAQGTYYRSLGAVLAQHPELSCVTVWGLNDARSWREGAPLLFDDALRPKPAFDGFIASTGLQDMTPGTVAVLGTARVGAELVADVAGWRPATATLAHQWFADGVPVPGARTARLLVAADHAGRRLHVEVTGTAPRHRPATARSAEVQVERAPAPGTPAAPAAPAVPAVPAVPALRGVPVVGRSLRLDLPPLAAGETRSVVWVLSTRRRGRARRLAGARGRSVEVRGAFVGRWLGARVTTTRPGQPSLTQSVAPVKVRRRA